MPFQHTSSPLPIGVEGDNCRLVLAAYTDCTKDALLPRRFSTVTRPLGGRSIRASLTGTPSLLIYGVMLASMLIVAGVETSLLQFQHAARLRRMERG